MSMQARLKERDPVGRDRHGEGSCLRSMGLSFKKNRGTAEQLAAQTPLVDAGLRRVIDETGCLSTTMAGLRGRRRSVRSTAPCETAFTVPVYAGIALFQQRLHAPGRTNECPASPSLGQQERAGDLDPSRPLVTG